MRLINLFLISVCLFPIEVWAQESIAIGCDPEKVKNAPGNWITYADQNTRGLTPAELAAERKLIASIHQVFKDNYKPIGVTASHSANYDINPSETDTRHPNRYGHTYYYLLMNFPNYCKAGKVQKHDHSSATLLINVNAGPTIGTSYDTIAIIDRNGEVNSGAAIGYHILDRDLIPNGKLPDVSDGWYAYGGPDATHISAYFWWITPKGSELPFQYVTRKEFLRKQVAIQQAYIADAKRIRDNKETQNVYKQSGQLDYFLNAQNKLIANLEKTLAAYQKDLEKDTGWLNEWAVAKESYNGGVTRYVFTTLKDQEFIVPVKPNPGYYNRKLPKSAPQFINIWLRVSEGENHSIKAMKKVIEDNMDKFVGMVENAGN